MDSSRPGKVKGESILANGLTERQEKFAVEYCICFNKKEATIRAGYSKKSAATFGGELYNNPKIRNRIKEILQEQRKEYDVTVERVQKEIARIAFADPSELLESFGQGMLSFKSLEEIPKRLRVAIKSFKVTKDGITVTFHEKTAALEMLAKHFGYFEEDNEQKRPQLGPAIYLPSNNRETQPVQHVALVPAAGATVPDSITKN